MNRGEIDSAGKYAALLSMSEVGLGSLLHAWRAPFAGHFLSLNQGFISGKSIQSSDSHNPWTALQVAMIAALLKSLSPAGKRLTPMLAISVQGLLYSLAVVIFGSGYLGSLLAILVLSLWAFLQPVLLYLLVFGKTAVDVAQYFFLKIQQVVPITPEQLFTAVGLLVLIKLVLATLVNHWVFFRHEDECESYFQGVLKSFHKVQPKKVFVPNGYWPKTKIILKDMLKPWFLLSIVLMTLFFYLTQPEGVSFIWFILRPLACGFIVFYFLRFFPADKWLRYIIGNRDSSALKIFERALHHIKAMEKAP